MQILLIAILVFAFVSMVFNVAYILHELGWFPHGKNRGIVSFLEETKHGGRWPTDDESRRTDSSFVVQSPYVETLRHHVYPEVYEDGDLQDRVRRVLERWREKPTLGRREDLINVINRVTSREEASAEMLDLIEQARQEVLSREVEGLAERSEGNV